MTVQRRMPDDRGLQRLGRPESAAGFLEARPPRPEAIGVPIAGPVADADVAIRGWPGAGRCGA